MNNEICPLCKKRTAEIITKNDAIHGRFVHIVACSSCGKINEIVEPYTVSKNQKGSQKMIDCSKAENYFAEKRRMTKRTRGQGCKIKCSECPLSSQNNGTSECISCITFEMYQPEKAIAIVQKWSDEHPQTTYLSEFLKNYPNAELDEDGTPNGLCPCQLGLKCDEDRCLDAKPYCVKCWNQLIEESEK